MCVAAGEEAWVGKCGGEGKTGTSRAHARALMLQAFLGKGAKSDPGA